MISYASHRVSRIELVGKLSEVSKYMAPTLTCSSKLHHNKLPIQVHSKCPLGNTLCAHTNQ